MKASICAPAEGSGLPVSSSSMLAQQLGRPLNSVGGGRVLQIQSPGNPTHGPAHSTGPPHGMQVMQQMNSGEVDCGQPVVSGHGPMTASEHQELPDSVTAELEKLEQEQHNDAVVDGDPGELVDLGMDDDELLGMGADFNILEYADPELDQVVGGEKTNILDNLDLEEEKEEEKDVKDVKRKEDVDK